MLHATLAIPDLTTFAGLDDLGLIAVGQRITADRAALESRVAVPDPWCRSCGARGTSRGSISRSVAHEAFGHRPATLLLGPPLSLSAVWIPWRESMASAAPERARLTHGGIRWALKALVIDHLSVSRIAAGLGVAWRTANEAVLAEGRRVLINDEARFDDVRVIGADEQGSGPGRQVKKTARDLGIHEVTLHTWLRQDDIDQGRRPGRSSRESAELRAACGRVRQLEQEIAILHRAATWLDEEGGVDPKWRTR